MLKRVGVDQFCVPCYLMPFLALAATFTDFCHRFALICAFSLRLFAPSCVFLRSFLRNFGHTIAPQRKGKARARQRCEGCQMGWIVRKVLKWLFLVIATAGTPFVLRWLVKKQSKSQRDH